MLANEIYEGVPKMFYRIPAKTSFNLLKLCFKIAGFQETKSNIKWNAYWGK